MHFRGFAWLLAATAAVAAAYFAVSGIPEDDIRRPLKITDVEGVWSTTSGASLTVRTDGSAELERISEPEADCGQSTTTNQRTYSGSATWEFDSIRDEAPGVRFDFHGPNSGKSCKIYLVVFPEKNAGKGFLFHDDHAQYLRSMPSPDAIDQ